jgi:hypothetical protein
MDFYYLKNIAGRRLVGLRWWNEVDTQTGDGRWVFESADPETRDVNATDKRFFWIALYAQPVLWILLAILALVGLNFIWLTLVGKSCRCEGGGVIDWRGLIHGQLLRSFLRLRIRLHSRGATSLARRVGLLRMRYTGLGLRGTWREVSSVACSGDEQACLASAAVIPRYKRALDAVGLDMGYGVGGVT